MKKFTIEDFYIGLTAIREDAHDWWHKRDSKISNHNLMAKYYPNYTGKLTDEMIVNIYIHEHPSPTKDV